MNRNGFVTSSPFHITFFNTFPLTTGFGAVDQQPISLSLNSLTMHLSRVIFVLTVLLIFPYGFCKKSPSNSVSQVRLKLEASLKKKVPKPDKFRSNKAESSLTKLVRTMETEECSECDKTQPSPCGDTGFTCLSGLCVRKAKDVKKCHGELPPADLCEICITGVRECASEFVCFLNHCIKPKKTPEPCSEDDKSCQLDVLRICSGSGKCQRCAGGLPKCGYKLRCIDGRCADSFKMREKCDGTEENDSYRNKRMNRIEKLRKIVSRRSNESRGGSKGTGDKSVNKCSKCASKNDCVKDVCDGKAKKCKDIDCYNGYCSKSSQEAYKCASESLNNSKRRDGPGPGKNMKKCERCVKEEDCIEIFCDGHANGCKKVKCIGGFCAKNQKYAIACTRQQGVSRVDTVGKNHARSDKNLEKQTIKRGTD